MRLPNAERAYIQRAKVIDYLLSPREMGDKSGFFLRFGFGRERPEELEEALLEHSRRFEVAEVVETPFGTKYIINGPLTTPDGRNPEVQVVWQTDRDVAAPRLVTAYRKKR